MKKPADGKDYISFYTADETRVALRCDAIVSLTQDMRKDRIIIATVTGESYDLPCDEFADLDMLERDVFGSEWSES